jgi:hypothetical protein
MNHLFPGDGLEAVSIGTCGRHRGARDHVLTLRKLVHIPYDECRRSDLNVTWSTRRLEELLVEAVTRDLAVVKFHCHPGGFGQFSDVDDRADADLFGSVHGWTDGVDPHASVVVLPQGRMFGRAVHVDGQFEPLDRIAVVGDDLHFFDQTGAEFVPHPAFNRQVRLFGAATNALLQRLAIGVVGCSGTGGPVIEMLARLGVGRLVLVDPDRVGDENLPRIPNTTAADADDKLLKVDVLARAVRSMGLVTMVETHAENIAESPAAIRALASVDVLIGCVDSVEGRHVLNRLASFYNLPYFDVGVKLLADGDGTVHEVCGAVHYVQPDGSSLMGRGVYTVDRLRAEAMKRSDPAAYAELRRSKYIDGVEETRPAVVSVNTEFAAMLVNELLARLHPYRLDDNAQFAVVRRSLAQMESYCEPDDENAERTFMRHVGRGDVLPLLEMPQLSELEISR